jgi:heptosyltransferase-1
VKVLIVKTSALGDVVHALPVLVWIKSAEPDAQIDWLVEKSFAPLLDNHPLIHRIHQVDTKGWRKEGVVAGLRGLMCLTGVLRDESYDIVLDLQGNSKSGLFTLLSKARRRYGFARDGVREWPALLATHVKVPLTEADHHVSTRSLAVARAAFPSGKGAPLAGPLATAEASKYDIDKMLQERGLGARLLVVFHYGTTWKTKLWAIENWCSLAQQMSDTHQLDVLLTWGNEEEKAAAEIICAATDGRAIVWPRGTLKDLIALLERADLVVGCDTGPIHIAAAVDTSTVSIYRVTDAYRNGPRGNNHRLLQVPLPCAACLRKYCSQDSECAKAITPERVFAEIEKLLYQDGDEQNRSCRISTE